MGEAASEKRFQAIALLRSTILRVMVLLGLPLITAIRFGPVIDPADQNHTNFNKLYFFVFFRFEPALLVVSLLALAAALGWLFRQRLAADPMIQPLAVENRRPWLAGLVLLVFGVTAAGTQMVFHSHRLVCDEFLTLWQAKIFLGGNLVAEVSPEYRPFAFALQTRHSMYDQVSGVWNSCTLPLYAAFYAPAEAAGLGELFNPLIAALTVLVVARVARRLWPVEAAAPLLAALFLATSCQFLVNAMSFFTMPAYLLCDLVWLLLYLRDGKADRFFLPWVGVIGLGLHQPFYHALFVIPFLIRLVRTRPLTWSVYTAAVYLAGCATWLSWYRTFQYADPSLPSPIVGSVPFLALPSASHLLLDYCNLVLLLNWQNLAAVVFGMAALYRFRHLTSPLRDLAYGLFLTFGFHMFVIDDPGLTWGYRCCHAVLGNLVLLAVAGTLAIQAECGKALVQRLVAGSAILTVAVFLPLRAWQLESFVRPVAKIDRWLASLADDVVVVEGTENLLLGLELVRNSPALSNRPLLIDYGRLRPDQLAELKNRNTVRFVTEQELVSLGLLRGNPAEPAENGPGQGQATTRGSTP